MKSIAKTIGYLLWIGSAIFLFVFWLSAMSRWLGGLGTFLAFILCPGVIIFPIVFWVVEGVFPGAYFVVWAIGIMGIIMVRSSSAKESAAKVNSHVTDTQFSSNQNGLHDKNQNIKVQSTRGSSTDLLDKAADALRYKTSVGKAVSASPLVGSLLKKSGLFGASGQISVSFAASLEERASNFWDSMGKATLRSEPGAELNWKEFLWVNGTLSGTNITKQMVIDGAAGLWISKMQGTGLQNAVMNAALFAFADMRIVGAVDEYYDLNAQHEAQKEAVGIFQQMGIWPAPASAKEVETAFNQVRDYLNQDVKNGTVFVETSTAMFQQVTAAYGTLRNYYLPPNQQMTENVKDMVSSYVLAPQESLNQHQEKINQAIQAKVKNDQEGVAFAKGVKALKQQQKEEDEQLEIEKASGWTRDMVSRHVGDLEQEQVVSDANAAVDLAHDQGLK